MTTAEWGRLHATRDRVACYEEDWYEHDLALGGEGCPEVREYAVTELAAALGVSTPAGRAYLSDAVELDHRLPATGPRCTPTCCRSGRPAGSPRPPGRCHPRGRRSSTPSSPRWPTGSGLPSSTG